MNVYQALNQASIKYDEEVGGHNPFVVDMAESEEVPCFIVQRMGQLSTDEAFKWIVTVMDENGEVIYLLWRVAWIQLVKECCMQSVKKPRFYYMSSSGSHFS